MNAAFFSRTARPPVSHVQPAKGERARRLHRWVATLFTLSVAANFAVMPWGPPPAWITYAPLLPLLFLMITGVTMLVRSWAGARRSRMSGAAR